MQSDWEGKCGQEFDALLVTGIAHIVSNPFVLLVGAVITALVVHTNRVNLSKDKHSPIHTLSV